KAAVAQPVYFLTPSGYLVPLQGDFSQYAKTGRLRIFSTVSEAAGIVSIATFAEPEAKPSRFRRASTGRARKSDDSLRYYALELDWLTLEGIEQGAKLRQALDRVESALRAPARTRRVPEALAELKAALA